MSNDELMLVIGRLKRDSDVTRWISELEFCQISYCRPSEVACCLERMQVSSLDEFVSLSALPQRMDTGESASEQIEIPAGTSLEDLERTAIEQTLKRYQGNRTRSARSLGVSVRTLQRKLKAWGVTADHRSNSNAADETESDGEESEATSPVR
ncbi:DNA-binding transcriptional regulator DhaR [Gimesia panareensis]|uniref:DNA-binding transcriptional regulator DhaR n=2 Tax=Gimesia panareensis TaxID=2527978 RepID=A0A518FTD7_9PLAN|nr:DNA-binding transcriptional regulator DhaR [Gimesia panareensis]